MPAVPVLGKQKQGLPGACYPASLAASVSTQCGERLILSQIIRWRTIEKDNKHGPLASIYIYTHAYKQESWGYEMVQCVRVLLTKVMT